MRPLPKLSRHAPAGRRIPLRVVLGRASVPGGAIWATLNVNFFDSGTSALAVAIKSALGRVNATGNKLRVLLPAYACPNVLAAAIWAGGQPEYMDFERNSYSPPSSAIASALQSGSAIVVSVDAFGLESLGSEVTALPEQARQYLIHDLAQSYAPFDERWNPVAPYNVVSFGRGKPVSLTMGGALISTHAIGEQIRGEIQSIDVSSTQIALRAMVYTLSLQPHLFAMIAKIPSLKIGQTRFESVENVTSLGPAFAKMVKSAILAFRNERNLLASSSNEVLRLVYPADHPQTRMVWPSAPLWRIPIQCDTEAMAERVAIELADLGVTRLYGRALPEFGGFSPSETAQRWPNAFALSRKLITLPSHGRLGRKDLERINTALSSVR